MHRDRDTLEKASGRLFTLETKFGHAIFTRRAWAQEAALPTLNKNRVVKKT
jgi:hypothetical protein